MRIKLKTGQNSDDVQNGGTTAYDVNGKTRAKTTTTPPRQHSAKQLTEVVSVVGAAKAWTPALTQTQRDAWNAQSASGAAGFQLWTRETSERWGCAGEVEPGSPAPPLDPRMSIISATAETPPWFLEVEAESIATDLNACHQWYITPAAGAGAAPNTRLRRFARVTTPDSYPLDLSLDYITLFGRVPDIGQTIRVDVKATFSGGIWTGPFAGETITVIQSV